MNVVIYVDMPRITVNAVIIVKSLSAMSSNNYALYANTAYIPHQLYANIYINGDSVPTPLRLTLSSYASDRIYSLCPPSVFCCVLSSIDISCRLTPHIHSHTLILLLPWLPDLCSSQSMKLDFPHVQFPAIPLTSTMIGMLALQTLLATNWSQPPSCSGIPLQINFQPATQCRLQIQALRRIVRSIYQDTIP